MVRRALLLLLLVAGAGIAPATALAAPPSCSQTGPRDMRLHVNHAGTRATVTWRVPARHPARLAFRVARDGAVVRQTAAHRARVRLAPSRATTITVTAVVGGRPTRCRGEVRAAGRGTRPGGVPAVATTLRGAARLTLAWEAAPAGAHPLKGYRVLLDGRVAKTVKTRRITLALPEHGRRRVSVAAIDTGGRTGPASRAVVLTRGHRPPKVPTAPAATGVTETAAELSWGRSRAIGARLTGYRLVRDGHTILRVRAPRAKLTGLPREQSHSYRILAVDSLGWTSRPSARVTITTARRGGAAAGAHAPPGTPGAPTPTAVTDTAVSLAWAAAALPAGSQLRGYRLMRDGEVVAQVPAQDADVGNLAPKSAHDWTVAAVDTQGYASPPSPATRVVQADPPASTGGVHAYLLASTDASFAAFREHYRQIGFVYPTFYDCSPTGAIEGTDNPLITSYAQDRKVKVLPRFNCQRTAVVHQILTDPVMRGQWLDGMTAMAEQKGWDGVNIDFEAATATDRDALTAFIADLSDRLHARGKLLTQAVSGKYQDVPNHPRSTAFDYNALSQYDDYVFVMAWGVHWSTSAPGPQDDYTWVRQIRDYVLTMPLKQKFVMGTMLYGMDWPAGGGPSHPGTGLYYDQIGALAARYGVSGTYDADRRAFHLGYTDEGGVAHDVWYSDAGAVGDRVALAREGGLGVGFWRIGQEDERIWDDPRLPAAGG